MVKSRKEFEEYEDLTFEEGLKRFFKDNMDKAYREIDISTELPSELFPKIPHGQNLHSELEELVRGGYLEKKRIELIDHYIYKKPKTSVIATNKL